MRFPRYERLVFSLVPEKAIIVLGIAVLSLLSSNCAFGADEWDASSGTHWWYDPANWSKNVLPPANDTLNPPTVTDTQINIGTGAWDQGFGVLYDPANDPGFAAAAGATFPTGYSRQKIAQLYMSRAANPPAATPVPTNKLTLRGDLESTGPVIIGRSSGVTGVATNGTVIQESGTFLVANSNIDLGANEQGINSRFGYGNGTWDYRGGNLEVSTTGGSGLRLSAGGSGGPGGIGRFIMHNPSTPGHVRAFDMTVAGAIGTNASFLPDGIATGVGIVEFHFENGGTRPIQVNRNLIIDNGSVTTPAGAVRSARLQLTLDAAPTVNGSGVPQDLGLFDVAFSDSSGTSTTGAGDLGDFFSSANGSTLYTQGATVSATFGSTTYNWTISYAGNITWAGTVGVDYGNSGQVISISDTSGVDVVLKGLSSVSAGVPGDFNNDGKVDAGDYVTWRKNNGTNNALANDNGLGTPIGPAHYNLWRANFGNPPGSGSGLSPAAVPEPGTIVVVLGALTCVSLVRRRA